MNDNLPSRRGAADPGRVTPTPSQYPRAMGDGGRVPDRHGTGGVPPAYDHAEIAAGSLQIGAIHAQQVTINVHNVTVREERVHVQQAAITARPAASSSSDGALAGLGCLAVLVLLCGAVAFLLGWGWRALTGPASPPPSQVEIRVEAPPPRTFDEYLKQYE